MITDKGWTAKLVNKDKPIYYVKFQPNDNSESAYFFILVNPLKENAFKKAVNSSVVFDLKDFGDIIDSGFGSEAPQHVVDWVKNWYNH